MKTVNPSALRVEVSRQKYICEGGIAISFTKKNYIKSICYRQIDDLAEMWKTLKAIIGNSKKPRSHMKKIKN